jgi:hypothetical protein
MSHEFSDDQIWWKPADQPEPAEPEEPAAQAGWEHATRRAGQMGLRPGSRRPYMIAGVAVVALLGGAGAALAATHSPAPAASSSAVITSPAASPAPRGAAVPGGPGVRHLRHGYPSGRGMFGILHGQFVIAKPGGGYQTIDVQTGQVTAVGSTSITLKSADGFTDSYVVTGSTLVDAGLTGIGSVSVGNRAAVQATVSGTTATAFRIEDLTLLQQSRQSLGFAPSAGARAQAG